jgi:ribosome biogenesis GTPase A
MRVKYIFSSRRNRRIENIRKQKKKYPRLLQDVLDSSDIILEVLDARFVKDTRNFELEKEIKQSRKNIIYVLNKSDLISSDKLRKTPPPFVLVSCKNRKGIKELRNKIKEISERIENPVGERIVVGVIGYPNTGKSSVINLLVGKRVTGVGSDAGFTKGLQKLRLSNDIVLIDSPGVIPEDEYSSIDKSAITKHTKVGGRSYSQVKEPDMIIADLMKEYNGVFEKYYSIDAKGDSELLLEELGKQKGYLKKGGEVDTDKIARMVLKDWQDGKIKV